MRLFSSFSININSTQKSKFECPLFSQILIKCSLIGVSGQQDRHQCTAYSSGESMLAIGGSGEVGSAKIMLNFGLGLKFENI